MPNVALPQARIPLGWVMIRGERTSVQIDIEWMRALQGLLDRSGGTSGVNVDELIQSLSISPAAAQPEPQPSFDVAPVYEPLPQVEYVDARIQSLEAEVAFLKGRINDFAQGYQI